MKSKEKEERLLILCVDRDGDINNLTTVKTPTVGRKDNLAAAVSLALADPEEADANAMFEAIRVYDQLKRQGLPHENFEIATISGSQLLGVDADRKLVRELNNVLEKFPANSVILVSDGYSDEAVLPLVESRVAVTSVRRILIKHSKSIEETAALLGKYLKMLSDNPRYSRIALGIPGLLLLILVAMYFGAGTEWLYYTWIAFIVVLGSVLLVKGFGVDRATIRFIRWIRDYEPPPLPVQIANYTFAAGIIASIVGMFLGANGAAEHFLVSPPPTILEDWISILPSLAGHFILQGVSLIIIGVCVILSGRAIRWYFERDIRLLRTLVYIVVIAWSSQIFLQVSYILRYPMVEETQLIFTIFIGILLAVASTLVALAANMKYGRFFTKRKRKVEEILKS